MLLPIYDRNGAVIGFVKQPQLIVFTPSPASLHTAFKPGQLLRVQSSTEASLVFEVLDP